METEKENLYIRLQSCTEKLNYMIDAIIERYDFDKGAISDEKEALLFAYQRGSIWTELEIVKDYAVEIGEIREKMEGLEQKEV